MAVKKTGISRDLIIHPGETIADVLEDRGISQAELAISIGVSPAYVTVAAVAGGLAGLYYGVDAIPKEWLEEIPKKKYVEDLCEKASWLQNR